jgi:hypothetical protein
MKKIGTILAIAMGLAFVSASAHAQLGIPAKLKATKIQGNLVPAYYPLSTGPGTGDDEDDSPALLGTAVQRSNPATHNCIFTQGKFKQQLGKDTAVQLKGVLCGPAGMQTPYTGQLCAHTKQLATIMNEDIDKTGAVAAKTCPSTGGDLSGKINFTTGNIGSLTCANGSCKGTLPVVTTDPCPDVDKVSELRRLEVFDGPDVASVTFLGTDLKTCCGPTQQIVGGVPTSGYAPCTTSTQDVLGEMGTVTQGVP